MLVSTRVDREPRLADGLFFVSATQRTTSTKTVDSDDRPSKSLLPAKGVLPDVLLREAIRQGWVSSEEEIPSTNVQPASIDLRLGGVAYRLRSSFLPGKRPVLQSLKEHQIGPEIPLSNGAVLEKNRPYLIPLKERMDLPEGVRARANPKSSTGRLDVFTRVLVDGRPGFDDSPGFDEIPERYRGPMYLEVVSRSFTIQVEENLSLNQVRLINGSGLVADEELRRMHARTPLLYHYGLDGRLPRPAENITFANGLFLTVDLVADVEKIVGYRAKENSRLLDLSQVGHHEIKDFWEFVESDQRKRLILEPEKFYLLVSREGVAVPPGYAGEMTAYDPTSGELRTHYAGYFDPGFGFSDTDGVYGSRAVLEVRAHDVPFALEHGQRIAKLAFEPMVTPPAKLYGPEIGSSYQNQRLKVSKVFRESLTKTTPQISAGGPLPGMDPGLDRVIPERRG